MTSAGGLFSGCGCHQSTERPTEWRMGKSPPARYGRQAGMQGALLPSSFRPARERARFPESSGIAYRTLHYVAAMVRLPETRGLRGSTSIRGGKA